MPLLIPVTQRGFAKITASRIWIVPQGVYDISVLLMASGAGGGATKGGGGGAALFVAHYTVTPGQQINAVVGAGGAPGANGQASSFDGVLWIQGGFADGSGGSRIGSPTGKQMAYGDVFNLGATFFATGYSTTSTAGGLAALANYPGFLPPGYGNGGDANAAGQGGLVEIFW